MLFSRKVYSIKLCIADHITNKYFVGKRYIIYFKGPVLKSFMR